MARKKNHMQPMKPKPLIQTIPNSEKINMNDLTSERNFEFIQKRERSFESYQMKHTP